MSTIHLNNLLQQFINFVSTHVTPHQTLNTRVLDRIVDRLHQWLDSYEQWATNRTDINLTYLDDADDSEEQDEDESEVEDAEEYGVRRLLDVNVVKGHFFYLVEWQGYDSSANSWEPSDNISPDVVIQFWEGRHHNLE